MAIKYCKRFFGFFLGIFGRSTPDHDTLHQMVRGIMTTREDEIACDECFDLLDQFAELALQGKDPSVIMPLVQHHLEHCAECKEEYDLLMKSLRATQK